MGVWTCQRTSVRGRVTGQGQVRGEGEWGQPRGEAACHGSHSAYPMPRDMVVAVSGMEARASSSALTIEVILATSLSAGSRRGETLLTCTRPGHPRLEPVHRHASSGRRRHGGASSSPAGLGDIGGMDASPASRCLPGRLRAGSEQAASEARQSPRLAAEVRAG